MSITKSDVPNLLLSGLKTVFFEAYDAVAGMDYEKIATIVPSGKDQETYAWLGAAPSMREFKDERIPAALLEHSYTIRNKTWEGTIAVDRAAIEDDEYGQIRLRVQSLSEEARRHAEQLVFELLGAGAAATCYDGQFFFDTDHESGTSGVQSNKGTTALSGTALQTGITAMSKVKDDRGRPMGVVADTLVVPPDLEWTARELLESVYYPEKLTGSDTQKLAANVLKGRLGLVVSPYLTDTNNWYLLCTRRVLRPILLQSRMPLEFSALEANSESGFMRDQYYYGVRARYNVGFGMWQFAYGGIVA